MTALAPPPTSLPTGPSPNIKPNIAPPPPPIRSDASETVRRDSTDKSTLPIEKTEETDDKREGEASPPKALLGPPADPNNPQRPPIRPGSVRSKFDLELNPFEQSFSRSSNSQSSHSDRTTPPRGTDATSIKHNALPPLSSLTSPAAADPSQFPWLAGHSLRSGPLSPAMLAGPAGNGAAHGPGAQPHNPSSLREATSADPATNPNPENGYDQNMFRTGFTPGTGSGFTPGYTSLMNSGFGALPLPSPNTAAFLNMVTNSTPGEGADAVNPSFPPDPTQPPSAIPPHMQQHHALSHINQHHDVPQETITPNTLSALTGVFNDMNHQTGVNGNGHNQHQQGYFPSTIHSRGAHPPLQPHQNQQQGIPPPADYAQQSANAASQAANGLFLLSQAHHELSKREEAEGNPGSAKKMPLSAGPTPTSAKSNSSSKRKSDTGSSMISGMGGKNSSSKKAKKNSLPSGSMPLGNSMGSQNTMTPPKSALVAKQEESVSPSFSMDMDDEEDEGERRGSGPGGKETEEEKRKNFLERNRQAALKCRQRKKAWLNELQTKVEGLTMENERLQQTVQGLHDEVGRLSSILMQHRDCQLPGMVPPGVQGGMPGYGRAMR